MFLLINLMFNEARVILKTCLQYLNCKMFQLSNLTVSDCLTLCAYSLNANAHSLQPLIRKCNIFFQPLLLYTKQAQAVGLTAFPAMWNRPYDDLQRSQNHSTMNSSLFFIKHTSVLTQQCRHIL